jgi:hypothetical protein
VQEAQARAAQAGPLAVAKAQQDVIAEQTALAVREAELTEKKLESQVRRPADAEAYKQRTLAEAARDAMMHNTEGEAFRQRALAEANKDTTLLNTDAEASRKRELAKADADAQRAAAHGAADARRAEAEADAFAQRTTAAAAAQGLSIFEALRQSVGRAPAMTDKTAGAEQEDGERGSTGYLGGDNGQG